MTTAPEKKKKRRWWLWLWLLLVLALLPVALVGGAFVFLGTDAGERMVRAQVLAIANDTLAGKIDASEVRLEGGHLVLRDVKLYTPEGELAATIALVDAWVDLPSLAGQVVKITSITVDAPELFLKQDERGLNLLRAVALKNPSPPSTDTTPNKWRVELDAIALTKGAIDFQLDERRITTRDLGITGDARVKLDPLELHGDLALASLVTAPLEEQLSVTLRAATTGGPQTFGLAVALGGTKLNGTLELPTTVLTIDELVAAPRELTAFVPQWPLKPAVLGKGKLSLQGAALELNAGAAKVVANAKYDLDKNAAESFALKVSGVDLQELIGAELKSDIAADAAGSLADWRPETLTGDVKVNAKWVDGKYPLAAVVIEAGAKRGAISIPKAEVTSPGVLLTTRGTVSKEQLDLSGTLTAKDLKQVDATLRRFARVDVGGLAGKGALSLSVKGPPTRPAVKAVGKLEGLRVATLAIDVLDIDADVPDVTSPLDTDILLHAKRVKLGDRQFDEVTLDFYTHGRAFDLDVTTKGLGDLTLHLIGTLDADNLGAALNTAKLKATQAEWALEAPTRVAWKDGVVVDPFMLRDGEQRLQGHVTWAPRSVDASITATAVNLAKLPTIAAPTSLGLEGLVDAKVVATGTPKKLEATIDATLRGGQVLDFNGLDLSLKGTWRDERAAGTMKLASTLGTLDGTFDLPVLALINETAAPMSARFTVDNVPLSQVEQKLKQPLPVEGVLSAALELSGSADAPRLVATVDANELQVKVDERTTVQVRKPTVRVESDDKGALSATVSLAALGGSHRVTLATPLTLSSLRRQPPTRDSLLAMEVTLDVQLQNLSLKQLHEERVRIDDELAGTVTLIGELKGPVRAPLGELKLIAAQVTSPPLRDVSGELKLIAERDRTMLKGNAALAGKPALELDVSMAAAVSKALDVVLDAEADSDGVLSLLQVTPVKALVVLSPFELAQVLTLREDATPPKGTMTATLDVGGTMEALTARLTGALTNLSFDKLVLGSARFDLKATSREQSFTAVLGGQGRDDFKARGKVGLDLRLSQLRKGFEWKPSPVDASIEARNFDLGFLSGVVDAVRVVAGRLNMKGALTGTLGEPKFVGDAKLENGRVALAGAGDYRNIGLELHVTNELIDLKKLEAASGGGKASLVARAELLPSGTYRLTSSGSTEKFPIVTDDQLMATASLKYSLEGDVSSTFADIKTLELPRVDVELPDIKRKDLQDLQRPKDIIVLRSGERATMRRKQTAKDASKEEEPGFGLRAVIVAPRNLWVRGYDANIQIGLSDGFTVEYQKDLRLRGEARIQHGTLNVIGREFTIQKNSEVRFSGLVTQPYINVSAVHVNTREQVKITVTVSGKGTDIAIKPTSDPPMPESDIYAILATGRRTLRQGGGNTITPGQAASVVGQLAASQLKNVIAKKLPLDVLNFETSDEFKNVKLDVGWYLNDSLYLGGTMNVGANRDRGESMWGGRLEFQMTRTLSLEAYAGDAPSYGADAVFSRDF